MKARRIIWCGFFFRSSCNSNGVNERSEAEMWSPFRNKTDFELAQWFIEAKVQKDHIDRYFKKNLAPGDSNIQSAYYLLEAVA